MSETYIDCSRLKCPEPVMKTREALASAKGLFTVLVDNETARDNVARFARTSGCEVQVNKASGGFLLKISPGAEMPLEMSDSPDECSTRKGTVVFISGDEIGRGERELGIALMKSFLYASAEADDAPSKIVFMNTGVRLVTESDETAAHVKTLEDRGVEVLVCGTCLDFYGLKEQLKVGLVSNMYDIQSALIGAYNIVSI
jgi:selenium metabolism protein YedF